MALTPEEVERARPFDEGRVVEFERRVDAQLLLEGDGSPRPVTVPLAVNIGDAPNLRELVSRYRRLGWCVELKLWALASGGELCLWTGAAPDGMDNAEALVIAAYGEEDGHDTKDGQS